VIDKFRITRWKFRFHCTCPLSSKNDRTYFPGALFRKNHFFQRFYFCFLQGYKHSSVFNSSRAFALGGFGVKKVHPQGRRIVFVLYCIVRLSQRLMGSQSPVDPQHKKIFPLRTGSLDKMSQVPNSAPKSTIKG
jgi:hypothetical protein